MKGNVMPSRRFKFALTAVLVGGLFASSASAETNLAATELAGPQQVVEHSYAVLLSVMKDAKMLGYEGRFQRLAPAIEAAFNLPLMVQTTIGSYWGKATEEQRQRLVEAFGRMTTADLAARFADYKGEKLDVLGTEASDAATVIVKTEIVASDGGKVALNYLLRNVAGAWKVADVYANGVISEVTVKTADYAAVLMGGGVGALTAALDKKVANIAEEQKQSESTRVANDEH
jgi:phospholipid transport system substrate-binding protein